jgi:hypothetical protein
MSGNEQHFSGLDAETQVIERAMATWIGFADTVESQKSHVVLR